MASLPTPDVVLKVATGPDGVIEGKRVRRFVDLLDHRRGDGAAHLQAVGGARHRADR
jgi:hypothetical protein